MPIVIDEMSIQVEVQQSQNGNASGGNVPGQSVHGPAGDPNVHLINQCVEEVMEVLRHQKER